jgi:hypothetical protein
MRPPKPRSLVNAGRIRASQASRGVPLSTGASRVPYTPQTAQGVGGGIWVDPDFPIITQQPQNQTGVDGGEAVFSVTAVSGDESLLTYQWQDFIFGGWNDLTDGASVGGATTDTLTLTGVNSFIDYVDFRCVVTNDSGTTISKTARLNVLFDVSFSGTYQPFDLEQFVPISPRDASVGFSGDYIPFVYSLTGTTWPAWVILDVTTGIVTGTPGPVQNTTGHTVTATDAESNVASSNAFTINVVAGVIDAEFIGNIDDINVTVNIPMTPVQTGLEFNGTQTPFTYTSVGAALPAGISLDLNTGDLSGTPTNIISQGGIIVRATDNDLNTADSNAFIITVAA